MIFFYFLLFFFGWAEGRVSLLIAAVDSNPVRVHGLSYTAWWAWNEILHKDVKLLIVSGFSNEEVNMLKKVGIDNSTVSQSLVKKRNVLVNQTSDIGEWGLLFFNDRHEQGECYRCLNITALEWSLEQGQGECNQWINFTVLFSRVIGGWTLLCFNVLVNKAIVIIE